MVGAAFATRKVAGRAEVATERVVDEAIFESVFRVALFVDAAGEQVQFGGRKGIRGQALLPIDAGELAAGVIEAGRSCDDAVEIRGESLSEDEGLPAAGRAAVEVSFG